MSVIHTNNITNKDGTSGPTISGITTVSSTGFMMIPAGDTRTRIVLPNENIVTDGLVLYLDAGKAESFGGDGTTWRDLSGENNNGTLQGGVGFTEDYGGSLIFDGVDDYVAIKLFDHTATNSVEIWFKQTAYSLYSCPYAWGYAPSQRLQFTNGDENLYVYITNSAQTPAVYEDTGIDVTTSEGWVHITLTVNYNNNEYKIYKNGNLVTTADLNGVQWNYTGDANAYDFIDIGKNVSNNNGFINGNVGSLKIYTKILSASEVLQNYNATKYRYEN